mmetsp:Transcript_12364/g.18725  ORF Transcript_12364/g.18725 Transcript_12364/m.18725 type:complete len:122 (+) Transcript_12364:38-403(+)
MRVLKKERKLGGNSSCVFTNVACESALLNCARESDSEATRSFPFNLFFYDFRTTCGKGKSVYRTGLPTHGKHLLPSVHEHEYIIGTDAQHQKNRQTLTKARKSNEKKISPTWENRRLILGK